MADYKVVITSVGLRKFSESTISNGPIFYQLAVGDGNLFPNESSTGLVSEKARIGFISVVWDGVNSQIDAVAVLPHNIGGWYVNEVAIYDIDGDCIAVANYPSTWKEPDGTETPQEIKIQILLKVVNGQNVQVKFSSDTLVTVDTVEGIVGQHNTNSSAHNDIRLNLTNISNKVDGYETRISTNTSGLASLTTRVTTLETKMTAIPTFSVTATPNTAPLRDANAIMYGDLSGTASNATQAVKARYVAGADFAEYFKVKDSEDIPLGTLVEVCKEKDYNLTIASPLSFDVVGVHSDSYGCILNSVHADDEDYLPIGLIGQIKVRVVGPISKGDPIVSAGNGVARKLKDMTEAQFRIGFANDSIDDDQEHCIDCIIK